MIQFTASTAVSHPQHARILLYCLSAARHVDLAPIQRVPQPTRDVLVTRDENGEREFSGFGAAKNNEYADCFIDGEKMPEATIKVQSKLSLRDTTSCCCVTLLPSSTPAC